MNEEKFCCVFDSWFSNARRMGLAALISALLGVVSLLLHYFIAPIFGKNDLASVAFALWLILSLEKKFRQ